MEIEKKELLPDCGTRKKDDEKLADELTKEFMEKFRMFSDGDKLFIYNMIDRMT